MWTEFVGSLLYSVQRAFSLGSPVSLSHQKPIFDMICCDSVWFVVPSISETNVRLNPLRLK